MVTRFLGWLGLLAVRGVNTVARALLVVECIRLDHSPARDASGVVQCVRCRRAMAYSSTLLYLPSPCCGGGLPSDGCRVCTCGTDGW